jgi:FkbM family methyltransferase
MIKKFIKFWRKIKFIYKNVEIVEKSTFYLVFVYILSVTAEIMNRMIPGTKSVFNKLCSHLFSDELTVRNNIGVFNTTLRNDSFMKSLPFFEHYHHNWLDKAKNKKVFVDIGANIGFFTIMALNNKGFQSAIAVEPTPKTFDRLQRNIVSNNLQKQVSLYNKAVGSKKSVMSIIQNPFHTGSNQVVERKGRELFEINVIAFDDIIQEERINIGDIGFIKIDVEGFELNVLEGMKSILKKLNSSVLIFIEIRDRDEKKQAVEGILTQGNFKLIDSLNSNYLYEKQPSSNL